MKYTSEGTTIYRDGIRVAGCFKDNEHAEESMAEAARLAAKLDAVEAMRDAMKAYERWEADVILSDEAWRGWAPLPTITQSLWDRLLEIQAMRNAALDRVKEVTGG